MTVASACQ